jgi:hypothetical protein
MRRACSTSRAGTAGSLVSWRAEEHRSSASISRERCLRPPGSARSKHRWRSSTSRVTLRRPGSSRDDDSTSWSRASGCPTWTTSTGRWQLSGRVVDVRRDAFHPATGRGCEPPDDVHVCERADPARPAGGTHARTAPPQDWLDAVDLPEALPVHLVVRPESQLNVCSQRADPDPGIEPPGRVRRGAKVLPAESKARPLEVSQGLIPGARRTIRKSLRRVIRMWRTPHAATGGAATAVAAARGRATPASP